MIQDTGSTQQGWSVSPAARAPPLAQPLEEDGQVAVVVNGTIQELAAQGGGYSCELSCGNVAGSEGLTGADAAEEDVPASRRPRKRSFVAGCHQRGKAPVNR